VAQPFLAVLFAFRGGPLLGLLRQPIKLPQRLSP